jgi:hypothetical protein
VRLEGSEIYSVKIPRTEKLQAFDDKQELA